MTGRFEEVAESIGKLVADRNKTYGDSFGRSGDIMRILYPAGIKPEQVDDALTLVRILDKMFRIANGQLDDSYKDIAGYGILGHARFEAGMWTCVDCGLKRISEGLGWCPKCSPGRNTKPVVAAETPVQERTCIVANCKTMAVEVGSICGKCWDDMAPMKPEQQEEQRRSFAFGNVSIDNPNVTRAAVDEVADRFPGRLCMAFGCAKPAPLGRQHCRTHEVART